MANLESQKRDIETIVHNILLMDMRLGPESAMPKEIEFYLEYYTRKQNAGDLFVTIIETTKN